MFVGVAVDSVPRPGAGEVRGGVCLARSRRRPAAGAHLTRPQVAGRGRGRQATPQAQAQGTTLRRRKGAPSAG